MVVMVVVMVVVRRGLPSQTQKKHSSGVRMHGVCIVCVRCVYGVCMVYVWWKCTHTSIYTIYMYPHKHIKHMCNTHTPHIRGALV